jgi:hypothetical protein
MQPALQRLSVGREERILTSEGPYLLGSRDAWDDGEERRSTFWASSEFGRHGKGC